MKPDRVPGWSSLRERINAKFVVRAIFTISALMAYILFVAGALAEIVSRSKGEILILNGLLYAAAILLMFIEILFPGDSVFFEFVVFFGSMCSFPMLIMLLFPWLFPDIDADNDAAMWAFIIMIVVAWFLAAYVAYKWRSERYEMGYCKQDLLEILRGPKKK